MLVLPEVLAVDGLHVRGCHARHRPAAQETLCCSQTKKSNSHWGTGVVVLYAGAGVGAAVGTPWQFHTQFHHTRGQNVWTGQILAEGSRVRREQSPSESWQ